MYLEPCYEPLVQSLPPHPFLSLYFYWTTRRFFGPFLSLSPPSPPPISGGKITDVTAELSHVLVFLYVFFLRRFFAQFQ